MEGEQTYLGDVVTIVINHSPTGMILQVCQNPSTPPKNSHQNPPKREVRKMKFLSEEKLKGSGSQVLGGVVVLTLIFGCWYLGWWFQPIWKISSSKWIISPGIRGENTKNIWVATTLEHIKTLLLPPNLRHHPIFSLFASAVQLVLKCPFRKELIVGMPASMAFPNRGRWDLFGSPQGVKNIHEKYCFLGVSEK